MTCPSTEQLHSWLTGRLPKQDATALSTHVKNCDGCQTQLDALTDEPQLVEYRESAKHDATSLNAANVGWQFIRDRCVQFAAEFDARQEPPHIDPQLDPTNLDPAEPDSRPATADTTQAVGRPSYVAGEPPIKAAPQIDGFHIEKLLGRGGFGAVYLAWDIATERSVAIKLLADNRINAVARERFFREVRLAASVDSPAVVRVFSAGETSDNVPFLVMEYVAGGSLGDWIERLRDRGSYGKNDFKKIAEFIRDGAIGLSVIHEKGLIHRDVKPGNVLVESDESQAKLSDFGVARDNAAAAVTLTHDASLVGTLAYMSPEQAADPTKVNATSDVYSLGASLYHAMTGEAPFRGTTQAVLKQIAESLPDPPHQINESVPRDLETICLKALEKNPLHRYQTAGRLADDLERFLNGQPVHARPTSPMTKVWRWCGRNRLVAWMIAVSLASLIALGLGSSFAAWKLANANAVVRAKERIASESRDQAIADRSAAIQSLTTLVDSLYRDISEDAASVRTREKVVNAALDGLKSINNLQGNRAADRTTMLGHHQMGDLYSLRGDHGSSMREHTKAIEIARKLASDAPDDRQTQRDLAKALNGLILHKNRIGDLNTESEMLELKTTLLRLLEKKADDVTIIMELVDATCWEIDTLRSSERPASQAIALGKPIAELLQTCFKLVPANSVLEQKANAIYSRLARSYLDVGDLPHANKYFTAALVHIERAMQLSPGNDLLRNSFAISLRMNAVFSHTIAKHEQSVEQHKRSLELVRSMVNDPNNTQRRETLANSYSLLHDPLVSLSRYKEAEDAIDQAIEIYRELYNRNPRNIHLLSVTSEAQLKRADVLNRQQQYQAAIQTYESILNLAADLEPTALPGHAINVANAQTLRDALTCYFGNETQGSQSQTSKAIGLFLIAFEESHTAMSNELTADARARIESNGIGVKINTFDELFEYCSRLPDLPPKFDLWLGVCEARTLALRSKSLVANNRTDEADELDTRAVELLKPIAEFIPNGVGKMIFCEPDFLELRKTTVFRESGIKWPLTPLTVPPRTAPQQTP